MKKEGAKNLSHTEEIIIQEFINDLKDTADQVEKLLNEIQDSKINFVSIRTELNYLIDNVKSLTNIIQDGGKHESVLTRLALLEHGLQDLKQAINSQGDVSVDIIQKVNLLENQINILENRLEGVIESKKDKEKPKESDGKFKLYATIATGIFTLAAAIAAGVLQSC